MDTREELVNTAVVSFLIFFFMTLCFYNLKIKVCTRHNPAPFTPVSVSLCTLGLQTDKHRM